MNLTLKVNHCFIYLGSLKLSFDLVYGIIVAVIIKYEDRDLDFRYIVQKAGIMDMVSMGEKVNPTKSGGSDKGRWFY